MKTSPAGIKVMHFYESCRLKAYPDPGSKDGKPWTIGWGHTGPEVIPGMKWTQEKADEVFKQDLEKFEKAVLRVVKVPLTQGQFDALVSFVYNLGASAFSNSTLLKNLNEGDYAGASTEFRRWVRNGGKVMLGLQRRRASEAALFIGEDAETAIRIGQGIK